MTRLLFGGCHELMSSTLVNVSDMHCVQGSVESSLRSCNCAIGI